MKTDYISREAAIKSTWMILEGMGYPRSENRSLERTVEAVFESATAADVVYVVRCRECKHLCVHNGALGFYQCAVHGDYPSGEYFCADGERKDGGQDDGI